MTVTPRTPRRRKAPEPILDEVVAIDAPAVHEDGETAKDETDNG